MLILLLLALLVVLAVLIINRKAKELEKNRGQNEDQRWPVLNAKKYTFIAIVISFVIAATIYRLAHDNEYAPVYGIYVLVPAIIAIAIALSPDAKSIEGTTLRVITLVLLLSMILVGEGTICIIMAAPVFYAVGILIAAPIQYVRNRNEKKRNNGELKVVIIPALLLLVLELGGNTFSPSSQTLHVSNKVDVPASQIESRLSSFHDFTYDNLPTYLNLGFPRPKFITESNLEPGSNVVVQFEQSRSGVAGSILHARHWSKYTEQLVLQITSRTDNSVTYKILRNDTPMASWINWKSATISWSKAGNDTNVSWKLNYQRRLSPSWYFGPWEKYANQKAMSYLTSILTSDS